MGGRIVEKNGDRQANSTNGLAVYANKFHKSKSNMNLKNYSQLKFGDNEQI